MKLPDRRILGLHISPQKGVDKKIIIYFDNLQIFENLYKLLGIAKLGI